MSIATKFKTAARALGACLVAASAPALAATPTHPDFSGNYVAAQGGPQGGGAAPQPQAYRNTPNLEDVATEALQPWARSKMEATNTQIDDFAAICSFAGPFRHTNTSPFKWIQRDDEAWFIPSNLPVVGVIRIYMTDRHPKTLAPQWEGHSIGRWEGDTLVVDTIGWNDKSWLGSNMQPHTEELHLVRRIRQVDGGELLEIKTTVDDRKALKHPYEFVRYFRKTAADFSPNVCNGEPGTMKTWFDQRREAIEWEKTHPPKPGE